MDRNDQTRAIEPGYLSQDITKVPGWHGLVAWDLLFNNLTTGLFLFTAVGELAWPGLLGPVAKAAYPVALVFLLTDLLMLVSDLGDPLRFHHMLRVFKPSSPMSLGTWSLTVYSLPLTLIVAIEAAQVLHLLPTESMALEWIREAAVVFCIVPAFGSLAYKGVLFSTCSQPGWKDARWLGAWMANSALTLGCAELLAVSILTGHVQAAAALRTVAVVLVVLNLIPTGFVFLEIRETLARIYSDQQIYRALMLTLVGGTLMPVVLLLAGDGAPWHLGAVLLIGLGGFAVRSLFLKIPHASHESRSRARA
ncbi:MAG: NrfD/PsrC family molybdoenzyme membrane anchor subunit [Isosphaeraceae bacterium]